MIEQSRIEFLLEKFSRNEVNETEFDELCALLKDDGNEAGIKSKLREDLLASSFGEIDQARLDVMLNKVLGAQVIDLRQRRMFAWKRVIAAASIIVLIVTGYVLWVKSKKSEVGSQKMEVAKANDVPAPKGTKAMITLADGTKVYLDSAGSGTIAQQGNVNVVRNENGEISYRSQGAGQREGEIQYNMAYNPRGSKVLPLTLNDGTKVWLNAESSLKYPAAFTGNSREVEITGEAYFEVTHDASRPFHVKKGNTDVTVLGTHFNVNAYDDEDALRVTLLEGSVKVVGGAALNTNNGVVIKPGEQAVVANGIKVKKDVDVDEVMAWKNGRFQFNEASIDVVMRQIVRWYDVEVEFTGAKPEVHFMGDISRLENVSEVLKMLEQTKAVKFSIDGKKIKVMR